MNTKVALIINGSRKLNRNSALTVDLIVNDAFFDVQILKSSKPKEAIHFAQKACDEGFQYIISVGGDGTCNEVVNGIQLSARKNEVVFGIIPNGTGNDFHKILGVFNPQKFIESLKNRISKPIDLIHLESNKTSYFALNIAGIGFDGHVVETLESFRKTIRLKGKVAYALAILKSFATFRKADVEIKSLENNYSGKMLLMAVCNGKAFGHGLYIHPNAEIEDGKLSITLLGNVSFSDYIKNLGKLKQGKEITHPEVTYFETESISIKVLDRQLFTEVDGENIGAEDFTFSVLKGGLKLLWTGTQMEL